MAYQLKGLFNAKANVEYSFIAITPRFVVVVPVKVPSVGQIDQFNYLLYLKLFNCMQTNY